MDFLSSIKKGLEKSVKASLASIEVAEVFEKVNADLKNFSHGELSLSRTNSTIAAMTAFQSAISGVESDHLKQDRITLTLVTPKGRFTEEVAGWRQHISGYPCTLKFDGQELGCTSQKFLMEGISDLLSSVSFGNKLNKLILQAEKAISEPKKTQGTLSSAVISQSASPAAKPVARSAIKPAAKPAAKPVAKPATPAKIPAAARAGQDTPQTPKAKKHTRDQSDDYSR